MGKGSKPKGRYSDFCEKDNKKGLKEPFQIDDEPRFFKRGSFLEATVGRDRDIFCYTVRRSFHSLHRHTEA
uniref:hypothetical protein n=1 Tax=Vibrio fluminensis TaxID=2783614 RepID=UPI001E2BD2A8